MAQNTSKKTPLHRILIIISGIAFAGSTLFGLVALFSSAIQEQSGNPQSSAAASKDSQLEAQLRGYELVLQREPENQVALEGLLNVQLQMNDLQGATKSLEKLVKLNPENPQYKSLLASIKEQMNKGAK